jgi:hypothetical protein
VLYKIDGWLIERSTSQGKFYLDQINRYHD